MKVIKNVLLEIVTLILLVYVFYSEWNCKDSADHTGRVWCFLENTFDSEFDYSDNRRYGIYCKR